MRSYNSAAIPHPHQSRDMEDSSEESWRGDEVD